MYIKFVVDSKIKKQVPSVSLINTSAINNLL